MYDEFRSELTELLNKHNMENGCDTPDFILSAYLIDCLATFNRIVEARTGWYQAGCSGSPSAPEDIDD